jgi:signal transduction histidine kinase
MRVPWRSLSIDVLLAVVLTAVTVGATPGAHVSWLGGLVLALTAAPIVLRQRAPVLTMLVMLAAMAAYGLFDLGGGELPNGGIGLLIGMFTVATLRSRAVAAAVFTIALVATLVTIFGTDGVGWAVILQTVLVLGGAWVLGESTRRWVRRMERIAADAARAVADERVRIARELHDVVAHHMSVVALQSGLAEYVLDSDLPTARKAIGAVGDASREALLEMRRLLDVLRVDHTGDSDLAPQPGLASLHELAERARGAGLAVQISVTGAERPLPSGPDLCAYRVAQESLTNVLKHADAAAARIDVDYGERMLTLKVTDNGTPSPAAPAPVTSHGIRGMRERAELYGGVLTAGPAPEGGFTVTARLPIEEAR